MASHYVYDKAEYHWDTIQEYELPEEHAENHTVLFLRWLIEHGLTSESFYRDGEEILDQFRAGEVPIHDVYRWFDGCLVDDMLSDEGNAFARAYFDFEKGEYIADYAKTLRGDLETDFHVPYTEENYRLMAAVIDDRYAAWRRGHGA